jgi:hypothetical protein
VKAHGVVRRRGSHIFSRQSAHTWRQGCQPYAPAALYPPGRFLVLISVRGWVDPRAIVRLEGLGQLKKISGYVETAPLNRCFGKTHHTCLWKRSINLAITLHTCYLWGTKHLRPYFFFNEDRLPLIWCSVSERFHCFLFHGCRRIYSPLSREADAVPKVMAYRWRSWLKFGRRCLGILTRTSAV